MLGIKSPAAVRTWCLPTGWSCQEASPTRPWRGSRVGKLCQQVLRAAVAVGVGVGGFSNRKPLVLHCGG